MELKELKSPRIFWKRVRLSGNVYDLAVARLDWTHWYWRGFVLLNDKVFKVGSYQESRFEAMKDAYCMANMHAGRQEDYPKRYWIRWRRLGLLFLDELICRQERIDLKHRQVRARVQ